MYSLCRKRLRYRENQTCYCKLPSLQCWWKWCSRRNVIRIFKSSSTNFEKWASSSKFHWSNIRHQFKYAFKNILSVFKMNLNDFIVIEIFFKNWSVAHCVRQFNLFTRRFFDMHFAKKTRFMTRVRKYFRCWLSDECYDDAVFESLLKEIFEENQKLFDVDNCGVSRSKIVVTTTIISNVSSYIFFNYNECGTRAQTYDSMCLWNIQTT